MRIGLVIAVVSVALAAATTASAAPDPVSADLIGRLERYCIADGRAGPAIAAAEADGLTQLGFLQLASLRNVQARADRQGLHGLVVGEVDEVKPLPGYHFEACVVGVYGGGHGFGDLATLNTAFAAWLGVEPIKRTDQRDAYIFVDDPAGRRAVADPSSIPVEAWAVGHVHMAEVEALAEGPAALVLWATARPDAAASPSAPARTAFEDFQAFCVVPGARPIESLRLADGEGWLHAPTAGLPRLPVHLIEGEGRLKPPDRGAGLLIAGRGRYLFDTVEIRFRLCGITAAGRDLSVGAQAWVGVEPAEVYPDGSRVYLFFQDGDHRRAVPGAAVDAESALAKAGRIGQVWMLVIGRDGDSAGGEFIAYGPLDRPAPSARSAKGTIRLNP